MAAMLSRLALAALLTLPALLAADPTAETPFQKRVLDLGRNEACAVVDVDGDGKLDVVSGENWYQAPDWTKRTHRKILYWNNYIDDFSDLALDVDSDGDPDIVSVGWGERKIAWFENPGPRAVLKPGLWKEHQVDSGGSIAAGDGEDCLACR